MTAPRADLDRPIFLIGAARSGTTIIGRTLGSHPDVAYWDEPKYVWRHGDHGAPADVRSAEEATPAVAAYIRERFAERTRQAGRSRFLEKTPSNCFRVAFMYRVFPDGLFLHVRRDGREAAASALWRWRSGPDYAAIWRRIRGWEIPPSALHKYLRDIVREALLRRMFPKRGYVWGPRYPRIWADYEAGNDAATLCAKQWAECEVTAGRELAQVPAAQVFSFDYEDLVREPSVWLQRITGFAGLSSSPQFLAEAALRFKRSGRSRFQSLGAEERARIEAIVAPVMRDLGSGG